MLLSTTQELQYNYNKLQNIQPKQFHGYCRLCGQQTVSRREGLMKSRTDDNSSDEKQIGNKLPFYPHCAV